MSNRAPDKFAQPYQDGQSHGRATPPGMGGAPPRFVPGIRGASVPTNRDGAALERARQDRLTRALPIIGSGVVPAAGNLVIDAGGPDSGYVWDVKRLHVGPADYTVLPYATGVTVLAFLRSNAASADNSATNLLSWTQAWPAQGTWSRHEAHLEAGEHVQVVIIGLPAGTVVTVGGSVEQTATDVALVWGD